MRDLTLQVRELVENAKLTKMTSLKDFTTAPEMSLTTGLQSRLLILFPQLEDKITELDDNLKQEPGNREIIVLKVAEKIINDDRSFPSKEERAKLAIHFAFASMTNATVYPAEIISRVKITREDCLRIVFSNLLRMVKLDYLSALVCVIELIRSSFGLKNMYYDPELLKRLEEEIQIYDEDRWRAVGNFEFISYLSFEIKGEPLQTQVTRYRNVKGTDGNSVRGGLAQFLLDFAQKAVEIFNLARRTGLSELFWLKRQFLELPRQLEKKKVLKLPLKPAKPVFSTDRAAFRLRYGRTATTGFFTVGLHPAAMFFLESLTPGSSLITDRFENKFAVFPVAEIAGPVVTLKNGSVIRITSLEQARKKHSKVTEILHLGDLLIDPADLHVEGVYFQAGYTQELWLADLKGAIAKESTNLSTSVNPFVKSKSIDFDLEQQLLLNENVSPSPDLALRLTKEFKIPYHPDWLPKLGDLTNEEFIRLLEWIDISEMLETGLFGPPNPDIAVILKCLLVPFIVTDNGFLIPRKTSPASLLHELGHWEWKKWSESVSLKEKLSLDSLQEKLNLIFIENQQLNLSIMLGVVRKTTNRRMSPNVHALFPSGKKTKLVHNGEIKVKKSKVELVNHQCQSCNKGMYENFCPNCNERNIPIYKCKKGHGPFDKSLSKCPECNGAIAAVKEYDIDFKEEINKIRNKLKILPQSLKTISNLSTALKVPENLFKGYLRALHGLNVFKDGTVRISAPLMPLTHWKKAHTRASSLIRDKPVSSDSQVSEIFPLDVIINKSIAKQFLVTCNFIDDLLEHFYGKERFFNIQKIDDLIGHFAGCITSDSLISLPLRIIGITHYDLVFVHPFYFAFTGKKASDPADFFLLLDVLLNFSTSLLPSKRGGTSGIPFFLEIPGKYDIMNHVILHQGPLPAAFFDQINEKTTDGDGWIHNQDLEFEMFDDLVLGGDVPYFFDNPNGNTLFSTFPPDNEFQKLSREKKLERQLELAMKLSTVDEREIIDFVMDHTFDSIQKQFLKFLNQDFICNQCQANYPIPPLTGICWHCKGEINLSVTPQILERHYLWLEEMKGQLPLEEHHLNEIKRIKLELKAVLKRKQKSLTEVFDTEDVESKGYSTTTKKTIRE
ncbi:MAG: hypothetical protein ACXADA_14025 [Candidatus Hodarchaeales archaeon]|jgi:DNA polymerase II large subunit